MKKKILASVLAGVIGSLTLVACYPGKKRKHPDFETRYTVEEHKQRISAITKHPI